MTAEALVSNLELSRRPLPHPRMPNKSAAAASRHRERRCLPTEPPATSSPRKPLQGGRGFGAVRPTHQLDVRLVLSSSLSAASASSASSCVIIPCSDDPVGPAAATDEMSGGQTPNAGARTLRPQEPLWHPERASLTGLAGRAQRKPPSLPLALKFQMPEPAIDALQTQLRVGDQTEPLPRRRYHGRREKPRNSGDSDRSKKHGRRQRQELELLPRVQQRQQPQALSHEECLHPKHRISGQEEQLALREQLERETESRELLLDLRHLLEHQTPSQEMQLEYLHRHLHLRQLDLQSRDLDHQQKHQIQSQELQQPDRQRRQRMKSQEVHPPHLHHLHYLQAQSHEEHKQCPIQQRQLQQQQPCALVPTQQDRSGVKQDFNPSIEFPPAQPEVLRVLIADSEHQCDPINVRLMFPAPTKALNKQRGL